MKKAIKEVKKKIAAGKCPRMCLFAVAKKFQVSYRDLKFAIDNNLKK